MGNPLREQLWLYRIRSKKDPEAFAALYDKHKDGIFRFVLYKVGSAEDAQEVVSEVFMKAWKYLVDGSPVSNVAGLLYTVARASIADHWRKKKLELVPLESIAEPADLVGADRTVATEEMGETFAAIYKLKDEYREVLLMKHIGGRSTGEIASALGKTTGTVRVLLYRARNALKEILK